MQIIVDEASEPDGIAPDPVEEPEVVWARDGIANKAVVSANDTRNFFILKFSLGWTVTNGKNAKTIGQTNGLRKFANREVSRYRINGLLPTFVIVRQIPHTHKSRLWSSRRAIAMSTPYMRRIACKV